jgi:hypothetical protein
MWIVHHDVMTHAVPDLVGDLIPAMITYGPLE